MNRIETRARNPLPIIFLDEGENPFVYPGAGISFYDDPLVPSNENKATMKRYVRAIAPDLVAGLNRELSMAERGPLLDVGIADEGDLLSHFEANGIATQGLSIQRYPAAYPPKRLNDFRFDGDIALAADQGSEIAPNTYGTVLFWGSWDTSGATEENHMIGNTVHIRAKRNNPSITLAESKQLVSQERDNIFAACKHILKPNGLMGLVSAHYSFYGGGFNYQHVDHSMLSMLDFIRRGFAVGAAKAYLLGRSREFFEEQTLREIARIDRYFAGRINTMQEVAERLNSPLVLPDDIPDSFLTKEDVAQANDIWKQTAASENIGILDAVFIEFPAKSESLSRAPVSK